MPRVLVVDDSAADRLVASGILAEDPSLTIETVEDGAKALDRIRADPPDLVLTDLIMPGMDGFEVVAAVREDFPSVPIVLMTSQGNEEIAVRALSQGASSYVPKRNLADSLLSTVQEILGLVRRKRAEERVFEALNRCDLTFCLENLEEHILPLVRHLQDVTAMMGICDEAEVTQVGVALAEALGNAIEHGNLEVEGAMRGDLEAHDVLMRERKACPPWCDRRVHVEARLTREEAVFSIRDEGRGFDPGSLPDPRDPEMMQRVHGRGVLLMRSFMDEVTWNEAGNEVRMVKRRESDSTEAEPDLSNSPS
jgi:CheY-like chemotaxis protein/anti-sigma regulatory factor (Ser/Thr protein kinase)